MGKPVAFIGYVVPKLTNYRYDLNEFVYQINEKATAMYFLIKGTISLTL